MKKKQEVKQWKKREPGAMYDTRQRREEALNSALLHGLSPTQDSAVFNVKFIIVSVILEATGKTSSFPQTTPRCCPALSPRGGRDHSRGDNRRLPAWRQPTVEVQLISVDVNFHCPVQGPLR